MNNVDFRYCSAKNKPFSRFQYNLCQLQETVYDTKLIRRFSVTNLKWRLGNRQMRLSHLKGEVRRSLFCVGRRFSAVKHQRFFRAKNKKVSVNRYVCFYGKLS